MKRINLNNKKALALSLGFFSFLALNSCKENIYGDTDLVPGVDNKFTFELDYEDVNAALSVKMFDSLNTGNSATPIVALGSLRNDPFYGDMSAGFYMQFTVPSLEYQFPDSVATIDSIQLMLPFTGFVYGDTTAKISLNVYEINDPSFKVDTSSKKYYAFDSLDIKTNIVGSKDVALSQLSKDTIVYPSADTVVNQLRVKLSNEILDKFASLTTADTRNNSAFVRFFNGLYVKPNLSKGSEYDNGIAYFNLYPTNSTKFSQGRIEVHYTLKNGTKGITFFNYNNTYSAFFSNIKKQYEGKPAAAYAEDNIIMDSVLLQGGPGFQTNLKLDFKSIPEGSVIHVARLKLHVKKDEVSEKYTYPVYITLNGVNEDGTYYNISDNQITSGSNSSNQYDAASSFVDGSGQEKYIDGDYYNTYILNFPREVQKTLFKENKELNLRIFPYYQYPGAFRFIAKGFKDMGNAKATLQIIYTKPK